MLNQREMPDMLSGHRHFGAIEKVFWRSWFISGVSANHFWLWVSAPVLIALNEGLRTREL